MKNLAPGDFKTVRENFFFHNTKEISHNFLIKALKTEIEMKDSYCGHNKIGF